MTSGQLAERFGLTQMGVRQHLYALQAEGFVSVEERKVPEAVGLWWVHLVALGLGLWLLYRESPPAWASKPVRVPA